MKTASDHSMLSSTGELLIFFWTPSPSSLRPGCLTLTFRPVRVGELLLPQLLLRLLVQEVECAIAAQLLPQSVQPILFLKLLAQGKGILPRLFCRR